ncbi:diaminobutyrate--2-oxoglutarate transaminase [Micromonospora sp. DT41]|uniref:diaminobutyrate--2-oxoglutarate transaminase n=1 Tax=Micromonospora sp. DT41 TaxID=3393437 RepID=UPI003CEBB32F
MSEKTACQRYESQVRSYCREFPVVFQRADGPYMWDVSGRRYVDLLCGAGALNYGHNDPHIATALRDYLLSGGPVTSLDLYTVAKSRFVERFVDVVLRPRGMDHVLQFPGPAGTLAVEAAIKLARKVTGRTNVIAFSGGFHGASLGSLALSSSPLLRRAAGTPLSAATILPYDDGSPTALDHLERMLQDRGGIDPPAALVVETVQGEGGLTAASAAWLSGVQRLAREAGALFVVDDIQAGCGRTGSFFSFDGTDLRPDMVCLSKSLSGLGLPMAMVLIRRQLDAWQPGEHNGTFRGNNLAFVTAEAALDHWTDSGFLAHVDRLAAEVGGSLRELADAEPGGGATVTGRGLMSGLRFDEPGRADQLKRRLFECGVIAETSGGGLVLKFFPALTMTVAQWRETADLVGDAMTTRRSPAAVLGA